MIQNYVIFAIIELFLFCIFLYLIIRVNIYVNSMQKEVNELHIYLPATIRDIKEDLRYFNDYLSKKTEKLALSQQEMGFLFGKILTDMLLTRFAKNPFKQKMTLASTVFKLWNMRERLKATIVKIFLK
ncbi:MAG TPA: hypothetical protein P5556_09770 [Candidatus Gastranaerophilales bacterium]|nr:hypothetical protein [Candidatus Gastranaerophilales bacterium]